MKSAKKHATDLGMDSDDNILQNLHIYLIVETESKDLKEFLNALDETNEDDREDDISQTASTSNTNKTANKMT